MKLSILLKNNNYKYSKINFIKFKRYNFTAYDLVTYRNKIIENAIFNIIFPFFQNNYLFKNNSLVECVRIIYVVNLCIYFVFIFKNILLLLHSK